MRDILKLAPILGLLYTLIATDADADCWLKNNIYTSMYFIFTLRLIFVEFVIFAMFSFLPFLCVSVSIL